MEEQLISFETAKLAKEKGFGKTLDYIYPKSYKIESLTGYKLVLNSQNNTVEDFISAPTQSTLQKWLREVHNIDVSPHAHYINTWRFCLQKFNFSHSKGNFIVDMTKDWTGISHTTYEEALEAGLQDALKLIK